MKAQNKRYGKSLINFLLIAFRGIFFLGALVLIIGSLISVVSLFTNATASPITNLPISFSLTGHGSILTSNTDMATFAMPYAKGYIITEDLPKTAFILSFIGSLLPMLCTLFIIKYICRILESAKTGQFLIDENAIRLRWIALLSIVVCVIESLRILFSSLYLSDKLEFSGIQFFDSPFRSILFLIRWEYILASLFLLVIAEAFRIGAQLKQENDLTI